MKLVLMNRLILLILISTGFFKTASAQSTEVFKNKGYALTVINQDPGFSKDLKNRLVKTFFEVYPKLSAAYNDRVTKNVTFVIDTTYKGVAETDNARVVFSSAYMTANPGDVDVVTHEVMHIVQGYGYSSGPVWLTEGIADYARYAFGVDNGGANWALPAFNVRQKYSDSYRVTAAFLLWLEQDVKPGIVKDMDQQLRLHTYITGYWKELTGKTIDELWVDYAKHPARI